MENPKKTKPFRIADIFGRFVPILRNPEMPDGMMGYFDPQNSVIGLSNDAVGMELERTVLHEIFHATLNRLYVDTQLDEKFIEVLIEGLVEATFQNYRLKWRHSRYSKFG